MRVSARSAPSLVSNCMVHTPCPFTLHCTEYGVKSDCEPFEDLMRHGNSPLIGGGGANGACGGMQLCGRADEMLDEDGLLAGTSEGPGRVVFLLR